MALLFLLLVRLVVRCRCCLYRTLVRLLRLRLLIARRPPLAARPRRQLVLRSLRWKRLTFRCRLRPAVVLLRRLAILLRSVLRRPLRLVTCSVILLPWCRALLLALALCRLVIPLLILCCRLSLLLYLTVLLRCLPRLRRRTSRR